MMLGSHDVVLRSARVEHATAAAHFSITFWAVHIPANLRRMMECIPLKLIEMLGLLSLLRVRIVRLVQVLLIFELSWFINMIDHFSMKLHELLKAHPFGL